MPLKSDASVARCDARPAGRSLPATSRSASICDHNGVSTIPGQIALTRIVKLAGASAVAAALAGGSLEIGKASSLGAITAIGRGLPFTVIGNMAYYDADKPDVALVVSSTSDIKTAKDLEGKTIGSISLQSLNSVGFFAWLNRNGIDISTLKYTEFSASATLAAIERNQIAAAMLTEPFFSADVPTGKVRVLAYPLGAIAKKFSNALLFTSTKWATEHPDLVAKFLRASQEASLYVAAHESESAHLVVEFGGLDPTTVVNIRHATRGIPLSAAYVQPVIDVAAKYNVIPKAFPAKDMFCSCALLQK